jgi:DNA-binding NarL/FixJ family response regulator
MKISVGIADDHQLFLKSLNMLISSFSSFQVTVEALNGQELLKKLAVLKTPPDILLIDVNMPVMDGVKAAGEIAQKYPLMKITALSAKDDDTTIIDMIKAGCCSYLLKDIHPQELEKALLEINAIGYYNADAYNINYRRLLKNSFQKTAETFSEREIKFLHLACSDLTYKQIASQMNLSERTIDGYREGLFEKLNVQSRVGMALEAIRRKLVAL